MRVTLALALLILLAARAAAFPSNPPSGRAGDPPNSRTCADCHSDFALNSGDVSLSLTDDSSGRAMSSYEPGIAYDLRFEVSSAEAGRSRWGFELIPLAGEVMAGDLSAGPSSSLQPSGARTYLAHSPSIFDPVSGVWTFSWTAPPSDVGDILVWICANAANGDGDSDGDYIECANVLLAPSTGAGGAVTRVVRWTGAEIGPVAAAFDSAPCSAPSDDLRLCQEALLTQETLDGPLPLSLAGQGTLVFLEHDSDTALSGSDDLLVVAKDPSTPGNLLVSLR